MFPTVTTSTLPLTLGWLLQNKGGVPKERYNMKLKSKWDGGPKTKLIQRIMGSRNMKKEGLRAWRRLYI